MKRLVWGSSFRRAFKLVFKPDPAGGEQLILLVDIGKIRLAEQRHEEELTTSLAKTTDAAYWENRIEQLPL